MKQGKKRTWIFGASVTAAIMGYVFLLFLPGERATAELRHELDRMRQFVAQRGTMQARILLAERELARTRAFTDQWRENAPREARIAHVFVDITRRAEDAGVEIVRFEPLPPERLALLNRIPVDMACEGNYWQLFAFLASLEALSADFWIPDLKIEPATLDQNRLRCELKLAIFADQREISD